MHKRRKGHGWWLVGLAVAATVWVIYSSATFQGCVGALPSAAGGLPTPSWSADLMAQLALYQGCVGAFVERNSGAIVALFTVVLAISTIVLWQAGKGVIEAVAAQALHAQNLAEQQARDMQAFIVEARRAADAAENIFAATQRPWVKVNIELAGPLVYDTNGANLTFKFVLENIGPTPARNVWLEGRLVAHGSGGADDAMDDPREALKRLIADLKASGPSPFGFVLFPKDVATHDVRFNIPSDELTRIGKRAGSMHVRLIGAVDYCSDVSAGSHQTGFVVEVGRRDGPDRVGAAPKSPGPILLDERDVPAKDLRLCRSLVRGGYAD